MYEVQSQYVRGVKAFIPTSGGSAKPNTEVEPEQTELKNEITGDEAMQIVRNAGAEYARSRGRFAMARTYNDVKGGLRAQYAQLLEGIKQDNPELLKNRFIINEDGTGRTGDVETDDDFWGALRALEAGTSSRWVSPKDIDPLAKEVNKRYAEKFLGLKKDGLITFYRNAINEKENPADAAAGYISLDRKMAWDYNSQKSGTSEVNKGRYIVKAKPDEVLGILGLSGATDEFGVVVSPEVTSLPGRFERVGNLEKQTIDTAPWVSMELLDREPRSLGGSPFRFLAPMANFDYYALDSNPFGEGTGWSSFYEANGLELGAMPNKYNELYGEGAWEKDFGDGSPRASSFADLFIEFTDEQGNKKWGLNGLDLKNLNSSSNTDMLNTAEPGDSFDRNIKVLSTMQELMGKPFFVNKGHDQSDPRIPEKPAEVAKAPNKSKPTNSNIFSETYPTLEDEEKTAAELFEVMIANGVSVTEIAKADSSFQNYPDKYKEDEEVLEGAAKSFVQSLMSDWNGSPISTDSMKALQILASEEFGTAGLLPKDMTDKAKEIVAEHGDVYREFIKAQYQKTQEFFASKGITEVKLYRGSRPTDSDDGSSKLRPLSSWSTNPNTADSFGRGEEDSELLEETVPVSRIFSTQPTGLGVWNEKEVVVIGDSKPVAETPKPTPDAEGSVEAPNVEESAASDVPPYRFENSSTGWNYEDEHVVGTNPENSPTDEEVDAIVTYTGKGYTQMNALARGEGTGDSSFSEEEIATSIENLTNLIDRNPSLGTTALVYRGVYDSADIKWSELEVGSEFVDMGFVSTSPNAATAGSFGTIQLEIELGEDTKAIDVSRTLDGTKAPPIEQEVILQRGTRFEVVAKTENGFRLRVVGSAEPEPLSTPKPEIEPETEAVPENVEAPKVEDVSSDTRITLDSMQPNDDVNGADFWYADSPASLKEEIAAELARDMQDAGVADYEFEEVFQALYNADVNTWAEPVWTTPKKATEISLMSVDSDGNIFQRILSDVILGSSLPDGNKKSYLNKKLSAAEADELVSELNDMDESGTVGYLGFSKGKDQAVKNAVASGLVKTWAISSNDEDVMSHALQQTAKEIFGLQDAAEWKSKTRPDFAKEVDYIKTVNGNVLQTFLQIQYNNTQTHLANNNIKEVVVYRGLTGSQGLATGTGEVSLRPMSSWSTDINIATRFAQDSLTQKGTILRMVVQVEDIISTPFTGVGCLEEQEMVIKGGVRKVDYQEAAYVAETGGFD
jgi:hypothetical protein